MKLDSKLELARAKGQLSLIKREIKRLEIHKKDYQILVSRWSRKVRKELKHEME